MIAWIVGNTLVAAVLALVVAALCRGQARRPALCHLLWLLVLVALVAPPLPISGAPGAWLRAAAGAWLVPASGVTDADAAAARPDLDALLADASAAPAADVELAAGSGSTPRMTPPAWWTRLDAEQLAIGLWLLGSLVVLAIQGRRIGCFHAAVARAGDAPARLDRAVSEVAARFGIAPPEVRVVDGVGTPAVWCFGTPRLLWPSRGERAGAPTLIAHELAHIARRDHWVARLETLVTVLLWWHPLFWLARRRVHDYSELSADAWALWAFPGERRAYAEALIDAQAASAVAPTTLPLQGLCATGRDIQDFERRLSMIMTRNVSRRVSKVSAGLALAATVLVLPGLAHDETGEPHGEGQGMASALADKLSAHVVSKQAEMHFQNGDHVAAKAAFEKAVALNPEDGAAHARLGYLAIGAGDLDGAVGHLKHQYALGHRPAVAVYNIACARSLGGETKSALKSLAMAVKLGFHDAELMAQDGDLAALRGTEGFAQCLAAAERSDALASQLSGWDGWVDEQLRLDALAERAAIVVADGELQHEAGLELIGAGRHAEAEQAFERQAAAGHIVKNAHYNIACARALQGRHEEALAALSTSAELGMHHAAVHDDSDLASLHGDPRFEKLAHRIGASADDLVALKQALKDGDLGAAESLYAAAADHAEPNPWAAMAMGRMLLEAGRADEALDQFQLALEIGQPASDVAFHLARARAQQGDRVAALDHLQDAVTLGYDDIQRVGDLLAAHGLADDATRNELMARMKLQAAYADEKAAAKQKQAWDKAKDKTKTKPVADAGSAY